jgi:multicomponent Na+:H+ antiporter subunit F
MMNMIILALIGVLLIPLYEAYRDRDVWQKMLAFATISSKVSIIILVISVLRDDWMIGIVGVIILSVGNAALMVLAQVLLRMQNLEME